MIKASSRPHSAYLMAPRTPSLSFQQCMPTFI